MYERRRQKEEEPFCAGLVEYFFKTSYLFYEHKFKPEYDQSHNSFPWGTYISNSSIWKRVSSVQEPADYETQRQQHMSAKTET